MYHCAPTSSERLQQERVSTALTAQLIKHSDDDHFIINMHALHNAYPLRKALPSQLVQQRPLFDDRFAHHAAQIGSVRASQAAKRAETARKAKATREANKKRKIDIAAVQNGGSKGIEGNAAAS
jgi:hypothetical protein